MSAVSRGRHLRGARRKFCSLRALPTRAKISSASLMVARSSGDASGGGHVLLTGALGEMGVIPSVVASMVGSVVGSGIASTATSTPLCLFSRW
jgi:hypothetical protein